MSDGPPDLLDESSSDSEDPVPPLIAETPAAQRARLATSHAQNQVDIALDISQLQNAIATLSGMNHQDIVEARDQERENDQAIAQLVERMLGPRKARHTTADLTRLAREHPERIVYFPPPEHQPQQTTGVTRPPQPWALDVSSAYAKATYIDDSRVVTIQAEAAPENASWHAGTPTPRDEPTH